MKKLGTWVVLAFLGLLLCLAGAFLYVGWDPAGDDPNYAMTAAGYTAMTIGIVATVSLSVGLMTLLFYSSRRDRD